MNQSLRRALHWGGSALAIMGIGFVMLRLRDYSSEIDVASIDMPSWLLLAGLVLTYGLANGMLALAWWNLLKQFGAITSPLWAIRVYGISQIAKYVPGNIFHLAGRQGMGVAAGVPGWPLAKSSLWELGLISFTGTLFAVLVLPLLSVNLPITVSAVSFIFMLVIAAFLMRHFIGLPVSLAFGWYALFLTVSGLLFVSLVELLVDASGLHWLPLCGAYVLAWLAGLVTPGAPAGLGVRELVLMFLLKNVISEADLLLAVVLGRMVTVTGDVLFFLVTWSIRNKWTACD